MRVPMRRSKDSGVTVGHWESHEEPACAGETSTFGKKYGSPHHA